jgi:uncharacterized protein (DUF849 family)
MLQGCPNGSRCGGVPRTADEIAAAAAEMVAAGVTELHVHPKGPGGADTLDPDTVAEVVAAVRAATPPGVPVGVTTGAWAEPDPVRRARLIRAWDPSVAPDYASVNWHEPGAQDAAAALLDANIGVEAGLYSGTDGPAVLTLCGMAPRMHRVLAEVLETDPLRTRAVAERHYQLAFPLAEATGRPVLLHGEESGAWPALRLAHDLGADTRIGLEDVLVDPAGRAAGNAALVRSARDILRR